MKNYIKILALVFILLLDGQVCAKEKIENKCTGSNCAFCVYKLSEDYTCHIEFSVTHYGDDSSLDYKLYDSGSNIGNVRCTFSYNNFVKNDFMAADGSFKCPNVKFDGKVTQSGGRSLDYTYTIKPSSAGEYSAASESVVKGKKVSQQGNNQSTTKTCHYSETECGDFTVSVVNDNLQINFDEFSNMNVVPGGVTASMFNGSTCPNIYTYYLSQSKTCYLSPNNTLNYTGHSGQAVNQDTGGNISNNNNTITPQDCGSLFGDPNTDGTPAYYLLIAFRVIKYVAIIILIVFSILDFISAVASQNNEALQKAFKKAIIRLVLCVVIFLLPILVKFVLKYLSDRAIDLCGIS